jgi:hypothetical protein
MANTLQIKKNAWNTVSPGAPNANTLAFGELAWDTAGKTLYIGRQTDSGGTTETVKVVPTASSSAIGLAKFSTNNFVVSAAGDVQIKNLGVERAEIANDAINGDKIADDAVQSAHIADNAVALGTQTTGNYAALVQGTTNEIEVSGSAGEGATFTVGLPDDVTIAGNLTVQGDTVTLNTGTLTVEDKNIVVAKNITANPATDAGVNGAGITIGANASAPSLTWNNSGGVDFFEFNKPAKLTIAPTADCGSSLDFGTYVNP